MSAEPALKASRKVAPPSSVDTAKMRQIYLEQGWVHVPGPFLSSEACRLLSSFALQCIDEKLSFHSTEQHTIYQEEIDSTMPLDHCRNALQHSEKHIIDYDRLPAESPLKDLYAGLDFREMVREIVGLPELHVSACPFNAAYLNVYKDADPNTSLYLSARDMFVFPPRNREASPS
eukprot:2253368-Amphidinium_carterae.2